MAGEVADFAGFLFLVFLVVFLGGVEKYYKNCVFLVSPVFFDVFFCFNLLWGRGFVFFSGMSFIMLAQRL